jgi:putative SOS response-associated peptidase YedK
MCARFVRRVDVWVYAKLFDFLIDSATPPAYNIACTNPVDVVRMQDGVRRHVPMPWGFLPAWAKDTKTRYVNARGETIHQLRMFGKSFEQRRCLILGDGIIEWKAVNRKKIPYLFTLKNDRPFVFAGVWNRTKIGDQSIESCAIITTTANELFARIDHDRMPVLLRPESVGAWLDPGIEQPKALLEMLVPFNADEMGMRRVSTKVNDVRYKTADCLEAEMPAGSSDLFSTLS